MADLFYGSKNLQGVHTTNWSGIWASPQAGNIAWSKVGRIMSLYMPFLSEDATTSEVITNDTALPAELRPGANFTVRFPMLVFDNQVSPLSTSVGAVDVSEEDGIITIHSNQSLQSTFSGLSVLGPSGCHPVCITYFVD